MTLPPPEHVDAGPDETSRLVAQATARINALKEILDGSSNGGSAGSDETAPARAPALSTLGAVHAMAATTLGAAQDDARRRMLKADALAERIRSGALIANEGSGPGTEVPDSAVNGDSIAAALARQREWGRTSFDRGRPGPVWPPPIRSALGLWDHQLAGAATAAAPAPAAAPRTAWRRARPAWWRDMAVSGKTVAGLGLVLFAVLVAGFAVFLITTTGLSHRRSQHDLLATFRHQASNGKAPIGGPIPPGTPIAVLDVARLHLREVVVEGTSSGQLAKGPGHLRSSPLPGQLGNVVIAGRRSLYGAPFGGIGSLRAGDTIVTTTGQGQATYGVTNVVHVRSGTNDVIDPTGKNQLTLMTGDPAWMPSQRLAVIAALQTRPYSAPIGRPRELKAGETGTSGDDLSGTGLLVWALLLLLVTSGATWLYLTWAGWSTWLLSTPVLLALGYLFYESLTRLLPATL
jgi:sortase A